MDTRYVLGGAGIVFAGALLALGIVSGAFEQGSEYGTGGASRVAYSVQAEGFSTHLSSVAPILLDVRTPQEFAQGHLPGALNIDYYESDFAERLNALDRNASYAVYCRTGNRSEYTLSLMEEMGFRSVVNLSDGIVGWQARGFETCTAC